jgi:hypothetical protein
LAVRRCAAEGPTGQLFLLDPNKLTGRLSEDDQLIGIGADDVSREVPPVPGEDLLGGQPRPVAQYHD